MRAPFFMILFLFSFISFGQQRVTITIRENDKLEKVLPHEMMFAFEEFSDAKLYYKDGFVDTMKVNINLFTNNVLFWNPRNQVMVLTNPEDITKIAVGNADWLPIDKTFGEVIYAKIPYSLLRVKKTSASEQRKEAGEGGKDPGYGTMGSSTVRNVTSISTDSRNFEIFPMGENEFETKTIFYILADSKFTLANSRGFMKVFSTYKKDIDAFLKSNKINFNTEKDIITLLDFCAGLEK